MNTFIVSKAKKICICCKVLKSSDEFNNNKISFDGKCSYCRECSKIKKAASKAKMREKKTQE
jgi:hypothetical protein